MFQESLKVHESPGMPSLVPRAIVLCGLLEVLEYSSDCGAGHMALIQLSTPVTQLQVAPETVASSQ